ncbi:MAG: methyltransferase domain-containing protein [Candidatus Omnitrophica bacterium]|nr:methyltransferase domain-containing protein [Candidatus Omnitrophota bacterium]MDD5429873.1 methyltransferase domain-containing protein [Candidatus Omnitrophota bacterium]
MSVFDRYYEKYDDWYNENKFAYLSELQALEKVIPKFGKGLEIGVGTGRFAQALGIDSGIDPSMEMLKIAVRRGVKVCYGFGESLPFLSGGFDYAAIIISLCFVNESLKVLQESHRVLNKNGRIIIGIVDKDSFLGKFYQKKKSIFYKKANFFSVKEVEKMLDNSGFQKFEYYQTLFNLPSKMTAVDKPLKGYGRGGFVVISGKK